MAVINKPSQPLIPPTDVEEIEEIAASTAEAAIAADDTHAPLVDDKVPAANLPSYVDDVLNFDSAEEFPEEGEEGKIYVANDTNLTYRWSGVAYIQVGGASLAAGDGIEIENDIVSVDMDYVDENLDHVTESELADAVTPKADKPADLQLTAEEAASLLAGISGAGAFSVQLSNYDSQVHDDVAAIRLYSESEETSFDLTLYKTVNLTADGSNLVVFSGKFAMHMPEDGLNLCYTLSIENGVLHGSKEISIAPYSTEKLYNKTELCLHENAYYMCTGSTQGVWDSSKWEALPDLSDALIGVFILLQNDLFDKQDKLVSGTNIKTINGQSVLGSGDLELALSQTAQAEVQSMINTAIGNVLNEEF